MEKIVLERIHYLRYGAFKNLKCIRKFRMKQVFYILFTVNLLLTNLLAESSLYIGFDVFGSQNKLKIKDEFYGNTNVNQTTNAFKIKLGLSNEDSLKFQVYYLREKYKNILAQSLGDTSNEIGMDVIKGFQITPSFSPFIQTGLGFGKMDVLRYGENSISNTNVKVGIGLMHKLLSNMEIIVGTDYQYKKWKDSGPAYNILTIKEYSKKFYAGINYYF